MKSILRTALLFLPCLAIAQLPSTIVVGQDIIGPDGTPANGTIYARLTGQCSIGHKYVAQNTVTAKVIAGSFSILLTPTDRCTASGSDVGSPWASGASYAIGDRVSYLGGIYAAKVANVGISPPDAKTWQIVSPSYIITYNTGGSQPQETWQVRTSDVPLEISQVKTEQAGLPSTGMQGPSGCGLELKDTWHLVETGGAHCGTLTSLMTTTWAQVEN